MIKFVAAAIWICVVTIGAVVYSFQTSGANADAKAPALFGGLDYIKTDVISVPLLRKTRNCSGVSRLRHSASLSSTFGNSTGPTSRPL